MRNPVLRLSFGSGNLKEAGYLHQNLMAQFDAIEEEAGLGPRVSMVPARWRAQQTGYGFGPRCA